jgi:hypothetical protein
MTYDVTSESNLICSLSLVDTITLKQITNVLSVITMKTFMSQVSSGYHQEGVRLQLFIMKIVAWLKIMCVCARLTDLLIQYTKNITQFKLLNDCSLCQLMQLLVISNSLKLFVDSIAIITHGMYPL